AENLCELLDRYHRDSNRSRHHWSADLSALFHVLNLAGYRHLHSHAARDCVDTLGIFQRSLFQTQRLIDICQLIALRTQSFDLVSVFDGAEVLPQIHEREQRKHRQRERKERQLAASLRVGNTNQARVIDRLIEINLRRARQVTAHSRFLVSVPQYLRQQCRRYCGTETRNRLCAVTCRARRRFISIRRSITRAWFVLPTRSDAASWRSLRSR